MCERWVRNWTNSNILTPSSFVFSSTSFSFCWAAQSGVLRAHSPLLGAGSLYSILSPSWLTPNLLNLSVAPGYIIVWRSPASCGRHICTDSTRPQSMLYPDIFDRMYLFLDRRLGRRSICYISTQFKCKYSLIVKNNSISSYSVESSSSNSANSV